MGVRARAVALVAGGESCREAGRQVGVPGQTVARWAKLAGMQLQRGRIGGRPGARPGVSRVAASTPEDPDEECVDRNGRLTFAGRVLIGLRLREGRSQSAIATELGVHRSTVCREVAAGTTQGRYRPGASQRRADQARRRSRPGKIAPGSALWEEVRTRLDAKQSPEQISGRLRRDFPDRADLQVSHETIYQALYVQGAGALRHELTVAKALRQGRTSRRPRSKLPARTNRTWIGDATITTRPAEAADRAVPGHWEGDLVIGGDRRSALITLVERTSRYTLIERLDVHDSATVTDRLTQMASRLPASLWRSLSWDQGSEMADHERFSVATHCPVFFCDPHSPWQRPTNENTNGLIRDFFPKGTDFTTITDAAVTQAEHLLNTRPRKVLDFATPAETLEQLLTVAPTA
jgi:transposase, IS30 family